MNADPPAGWPAVTVEVAHHGGGTRTRRLAAAEHALSVAGLDAYAQRITDGMRVGAAQLVCTEVNGSTVPMAIVMGGWPVEGMCCGGTAPGSDDVVGDDLRRRSWECPECGEITAPMHWAVMHLVEGPPRRWAVPDPEEMSLWSDVAVRDALATATVEARDAAQELLDELASGATEVEDPYVEFWDPHHGPSFSLDSVVVTFGERRGDGPQGFAFVGCAGVDWDSYDSRRRRWRLRNQNVGYTEVTAGAATALLTPPERLRARALEGAVTEGDLRTAWTGLLGEMTQPWLHDAAAVADLERVAREGLPPAGLSL